MHVCVSTAAVVLASFTSLGREIEIAVTHPWRALFDAALLKPSVPMLDFLPMYIVFLVATPFFLQRFQAGEMKQVLTLSFLVWLAAQAGFAIPFPPFRQVFEVSGWQFLFFRFLYLGYVQQTQPMAKPAGARALHLSLLGCIAALFLLRHAGVFGLEQFSQAIPARWIEKPSVGPLAQLNLSLWVAF